MSDGQDGVVLAAAIKRVQRVWRAACDSRDVIVLDTDEAALDFVLAALRRTPTPDWRVYGEQVREACAAACEAEAAIQRSYQSTSARAGSGTEHLYEARVTVLEDAAELIRALPLPTPPERQP